MKPRIIPNATNRINARDFLRLMQDESSPKAYSHEVGLLQLTVPSNRGGRLRVGFGKGNAADNELVLVGFNGKRVRLHADAAKEARIDFDPGYENDGRCTIDVRAPSGWFSIWAVFDEIGYAREGSGRPLVPWNFWFYPFSKSDPDQTAWAGTSLQPLQKFEQAAGEGVEGALAWEREQHADPAPDGHERAHWEGHCNFIAAASIAFQPPPARGKKWRGVAFTCEELKFFAGEFMGRFGTFDIGVDEKNTWQLPPNYKSGAPGGRGGALHERRPSDDPAKFGKSLASLVPYLDRSMRRDGHALMMDLRSSADHPSVEQAREVWNHAVYQYRIVYWHWKDPKDDDPVIDPWFVSVEVTLDANADVLDPAFDCTGLPARVEKRAGEVVVIPEGEGRGVLLRGQVQCRYDGSVLVDSKRNRWNAVHPIEGGSVDYGRLHLPPRTALYLDKPASVEKIKVGELVGNPWLPRHEILQLVRLRKRYR